MIVLSEATCKQVCIVQLPISWIQDFVQVNLVCAIGGSAHCAQQHPFPCTVNFADIINFVLIIKQLLIL
jgi:hypothetical protein